MNQVLAKYQHINVVMNDQLAKDMAKAASGQHPITLDRMVGMSGIAGDILICANEAQDTILELVVGQRTDDFALTLYSPHRAFATPGSLLVAREEVIQAIEKKKDAASGVLAIHDPVRNRPAYLYELGFAQLIDILKAVDEEAVAA